MKTSENFNHIIDDLKIEVDNFTEISKAYKKLGQLVKDYKNILDNIKESNENIKLQKEYLSSELTGISQNFTKDYTNVIDMLDKSSKNLQNQVNTNNEKLQNSLQYQTYNINEKLIEFNTTNEHLHQKLSKDIVTNLSKVIPLITQMQTQTNNIVKLLETSLQQQGLNTQTIQNKLSKIESFMTTIQTQTISSNKSLQISLQNQSSNTQTLNGIDNKLGSLSKQFTLFIRCTIVAFAVIIAIMLLIHIL